MLIKCMKKKIFGLLSVALMTAVNSKSITRAATLCPKIADHLRAQFPESGTYIKQPFNNNNESHSVAATCLTLKMLLIEKMVYVLV